MRIYQGGFILGRNLRIVSVGGDVEACGGTHANHTSEIGQLKLLGSSKVQDGIVRLELVAGAALENVSGGVLQALNETAGLLGVDVSLVPSRVQELFSKWKTARKAAKKGEALEKGFFVLKSSSKSLGGPESALKQASATFSVSPEHLPKTVKRFLGELEEFSKQVKFK